MSRVILPHSGTKYFMFRNNHILTKVITFSENSLKIELMLPETLFDLAEVSS